MPDSNTTQNPPAPTPPEPPKKSARPRSEVNQAWLDEISHTAKLAPKVLKARYAPLFAKRRIDEAFVTKLRADLKRARGLVSLATGKSTGKKVITQEEKGLRDALIGQIHSIQAAAKQEYFTTNKAALADYYFAKNLQGLSRSKLETAATSIRDKAAAANLPGISEEELNALDDALSDYLGIETEQSDEQSDATQARQDLEALVDEIAAQRLKIQFAVDGLWPAGKKENVAIRREFGLPGDKAFKG
jgi:hypothetical protein